MTKWLQVIQDLVSNSSALITDQLKWSDVMRELVALHGPVDMNLASLLSQDKRSLTARVLEQVLSSPN